MLVLLMFCTYVALPSMASAQAHVPPARTAGITVPVTLSNGLTGTLNIQRFANQAGQLVAVGALVVPNVPTTTNASGVTTVVQQVAVPVALTGQCPILHLVLGPLNLDLLGLQVSLNQVVLDITAQSGPGNLLGNLLCAVANLLNNGGPLSNVLNQIVGLLNQILAGL